ncbi:MAG: 50S ribosomal protein L17 [bacterium]|nr:50S ribosomal protein L17 [bacterium]MDT8395434.1 50S ribosomal protein L17 [bacterium]
MRHGISGKKFNRTSSHRKSMFRNMVTSLLQHERIVTTETKAKEIGRLTEKMITLGKREDLHARRQAVAYVRSNEVVKKLFTEYAERYKNRQGGYTRVIKMDPRAGDNAPMALVELVDRPIKEAKEKSPKVKGKAKAAPKAKAAAKAKEDKPAKKAPARKKDTDKKAAAKPKKAPVKNVAVKKDKKD